MRLSFVAPATLSLVLLLAPGLRAQDEPKPTKPDKEKKDDTKKDDKSDKPTKKAEKGDEGDDDDDDKPKKSDQKLPINPFSKAKKGDWSVCVGKMKANFNGQNIDQKVKLIVRIKKVTEDEVTIGATESGGMGPGSKDQKAVFSLKENPLFEKWMSMGKDSGRPADISDWKVDDAKRTVGEKEVACKKVTAKIKDPMGTEAKLTLWVTEETKGWGCLAMTIKGTLPGGGTLSMDVELKGYGNGDTVDFGKKPDEEKSDEDADEDATPKKKDKAKKGDDDDDDAPKTPKKKDKKKDDDDDD